MPSNVLSTIAARARAHHDSLNAAYQATYSPGTSPRPSLSTSGTPSSSRNASETSTSSQQPERNITKAWKALKQHHRDMNQAYSAYYSPGASRSNSAAPTPKASFEAEREQEQGPRNYEKVWSAVKSRAVEHHRSVNAASAATWGQ
jgi:hypothetical protein